MKILRALAMATAAAALLVGAPGALAQATRPAKPATLAETERMAVELRQGMSSDEVQRLLGKPRRTALREAGGPGAAPSPGMLQWTYAWDSAERGILRVDFVPKAQGEWTVARWEWANY